MDPFASDPQICRQCGGLCCQGHPGSYADPGRFVTRYFRHGWSDLEALRSALPFLGMELRDLAGIPVPAPRRAPWGCVHLGSAGCRLSEDERPEQCKALIPHIDTLLEGEIHCRLPSEYGSGSIRERWAAFWGIPV